MKVSVINFFNSLKMATMIRLLFVTNLIDAALTVLWVDMGIAVEANPLMSYVLELGPAWFIGCKIVVILLACVILWNLRRLPLAKSVAFFSCLLYLGIVGIHVIGYMRTFLY